MRRALVGWQSRCSTTAVYDQHVILNFIAIITCKLVYDFGSRVTILKSVLRSSSTSKQRFFIVVTKQRSMAGRAIADCATH